MAAHASNSPASASPAARAWARFRRNRLGFWSLVVFCALVVLSLMAASMLASLIARLISRPLYHTLSNLMINAVIKTAEPPERNETDEAPPASGETVVSGGPVEPVGPIVDTPVVAPAGDQATAATPQVEPVLPIGPPPSAAAPTPVPPQIGLFDKTSDDGPPPARSGDADLSERPTSPPDPAPDDPTADGSKPH